MILQPLTKNGNNAVSLPPISGGNVLPPLTRSTPIKPAVKSATTKQTPYQQASPARKLVSDTATTLIKGIKSIPKATFADDENFFTPIGFVKTIVQGIVNTPGEALKGALSIGEHQKAGTSTAKQVAGDVAAAVQLPLLFLTGGTSSIAKQGIKETVKQTLKQGVKETAISIGKNIGIGAGFGALGGLQSGKEIKDTKEYIKNLLLNISAGGTAGGLISSATHAVLPLAEGLSSKAGAVFIKNIKKNPTIERIQLDPAAARSMVIANEKLAKSPVGKAIVKESFQAEQTGDQISIAKSDAGLKLPDGQTVEISTRPIYDPKQATRPVQAPVKGVPEVKSQEVAVPREQLPVGQGKEKASRLEARITKSLDKTPQEIKDQLGSTYTQMSKPEQIKKATDYITKKPSEAMAVLRGEKEAPQGLLKNSIYVAMENSAHGDAGLARKLASLESTRAGQELSILTEIDPNSPVKLMSDLVKVREEAFKKRYRGKKVSEISEKVVKDIKSKVKVDKYDWNNFIKALPTC